VNLKAIAMRYEFNSYQVFFYATPYLHRFIQLYQDGRLVGTLTFSVAEARKAVELDQHNHIRLNLHSNDYPAVIDLLRHESPLYLWNYGDIGGITTSHNEPVGEGEWKGFAAQSVS
jgi:hypothetical protein